MEYPWLRAASGIVAAAFLFGVVVIMAAGSGALLEQMTGLPTWIGNALFMLAVALVALLGVTGMVSAFSALIRCWCWPHWPLPQRPA